MALRENFVKALAVIALLALLAATTSATTYYIDYTGGNDANNGLTTGTAWKRCPYMNGFTGTYAHSAGDRFIFKGGVTWPVTCFQLNIVAGGSSDSTRDYYGTDQTWYSGGSWTRPLFDFQNTQIGGGWMTSAGILANGVSNLTFDGLELANHRAPQASLYVSNYGSYAMCFANVIYNVTVTNCLVRDWSIPTTPPLTVDSDGGGAIYYIGNTSHGNLVVTHCEAHQANSATKNGGTIQGIGVVEYTTVRAALAGIGQAYLVRYCHVYDLRDPTAPNSHANGIYCQGGATIYNNLVHDLRPVHQVIYTAPGQYNYAGTDTIYNNVVYNIAQPCIAIDTDGYNNQSSKTLIYNNTLIAPGGNGNCIRVGYRANGPFPFLTVTNNHMVTTGTAVLINDIANGGAIVTTYNSGNNVLQTPTAATVQGYTSANQYLPTDGADATVGVGADLSSLFTTDYLGYTRSAPWDAGGYEFQGAGTPGTLALSASSYSTVEDTTVTLTVTRTGGSTGTVGISYATSDGTALAGTDYTAASSTLSLGTGITSTNFDLTILRNLATTGNRYFTTTLSSPTGGAALGSPSSATVTIIDSDPPSGIPTNGLSFTVDQMTVAAPMVVTSGIASQPTFSSSTNDAGTLICYFAIATPGTYQCWMTNNSPNDGANSFWIRINGTNDVCDIPNYTSGLEPRWINYRGAGTFDNPEFAPMQWTFDASTNLMVVYGREAGTQVSGFLWELQSDPPPPPQQLAFATSSYACYKTVGIQQVFVNRTAGTTGAISVGYATADGTALDGVDYSSASGTLNFADGQSTGSIAITIINKAGYTAPRQFTITLSSPVGAALSSPTTATVTISDPTTPLVVPYNLVVTNLTVTTLKGP